MKCFIFEEMKIVERKQNRQWITLLSLIFLVFSLFTACTSKKKILYFNEGSFVSTPKAPQPLKCQRGDILDIKVYSVNAGVVAPFNQFLVPSANGEGDGPNGYLVGENLSVTFPLIGKIQVGGLTLSEIESAIAKQLDGYVKDPVVSVKLLNFEVTVLGEVGSPGLVEVKNAQTNLIEVLGMAGDITLNGVREDIIVIRNEEGKRQEFHLDITQRGIFDQDGFYLHQNDIIYVSPNSSRIQSSALNPVRISVVLTLTTLLGSFLFSLMIK
jgi:polysaccharide export outer membrane protein